MFDSPTAMLRRAAAPVVTAGMAGSPPVARFQSGGPTEELSDDQRMMLEILRERRAAAVQPEVVVAATPQAFPFSAPDPTSPEAVDRRYAAFLQRQAQPPAATQPAARVAPRPPPQQAPAAVGAPASPLPNLEAGTGAGSLMARLRESLGQSALPSEGESFRQQLMALGAGMAGSQSRTFAGAMSEGVRAMQQQQQQHQTAQRELMNVEGTTRYREAVVALQRAEQEWARDPNNPQTIERLARARSMLMTAAAAGARGQQERLGTGIPGQGGVFYPAAPGGGRFFPYPAGFNPIRNLTASDQAAANFYNRTLTNLTATEEAVRGTSTPEQLADRRRRARAMTQEMFPDWQGMREPEPPPSGSSPAPNVVRSTAFPQ